MKVVIAEKPSVARDIAAVLGCNRKNDGYLEGNGFRVTWAFGHLVNISNPGDMNSKWNGNWAMENLPIIPQNWLFNIPDDKKKQFNIISSLFNENETEEIIVATDAGREGEHIFRLIYNQSNCQKPFKRLWISSLTTDAIKEGFSKLYPGEQFNSLGNSAMARAKSDFIVGMTFTRAYTVHNNQLCTVGRVQTPTLTLIVDRDLAIKNHTVSYSYEVHALLEDHLIAKYIDEKGNTTFEEKNQAELILNNVKDVKSGTTKSVDVNEKRQGPKPLFNLLDLQREANNRFGFTATKTLEIAQKLYQNQKVITYPRTESNHISNDMVEKLPNLVKSLTDNLEPYKSIALDRLNKGLKLSKKYVDDNKLTDHHAIIITGKQAGNLSEGESKIFNLIKKRFLSIFLKDAIFIETTVIFDFKGFDFRLKHSFLKQKGWKELEPSKDDDNLNTPLKPFSKGETVNVNEFKLHQKESKPPKPFTDSTLLTAMKNAGKQIEDKELASIIKSAGLGTPATRAGIIERLIKSDYIERKKKNILATEKGIGLIEVVDEQLKSPELTAEWEQKLIKIENNEFEPVEFLNEIEKFTIDTFEKIGNSKKMKNFNTKAQGTQSHKGGGNLNTEGNKDKVSDLKNNSAEGPTTTQNSKLKTQNSTPKGVGTCPKCKEGYIFEGKRGFGCSRWKEGCDFVIWKDLAKKTLAPAQIKKLIKKGTCGLVKGFTSNAGKKFNAVLKLTENFKVVFDFEDSEYVKANIGNCPKCGQNIVTEFQKGWSCEDRACGFVIWNTVARKKISEKNAKELLRKGKTSPIKGFTSNAGKKFDASLKLDENNYTLKFVF